MKKLTLALLLAFGAANNTNAMIPAVEISAEADLEARIKDADLDDADKATVMTWIKDHKVLTAAVSVVLVGGIVTLVDIYANKGKCTAAVLDFGSNNGGKYVYDKGAELGTWAKDNKVKAGASVTAVVATVAAIIFTVYDLRKEADQSALRKLWASLTAKIQAEEAPVAEANVPA